MVENEIYSLLKNSSDLAELVGTRIYPTEPTENTVVPFLVYNAMNGKAVLTTGGPSNLESYDVVISCAAFTMAEITSIFDTLKSILNGYRGGSFQGIFFTDQNTEQEQENNAYIGTQNYQAWHTGVTVVSLSDSTGCVETGQNLISLKPNCSNPGTGTIQLCGTLTDCNGDPLTLADLNYTHDQITPRTLWTINHNLGKYPSITTVDSAGSQVFGTVDYTTLNQATVTFHSNQGGKAFCN